MPKPSAINLRAVESVLEGLRRELSRGPRGAVEHAVGQLMSLGRTPLVAVDGQRRTYRIDDLAHATGVTVRNIRVYQERGLLPPPEKRGRVVWFDDAHVARLRIITSMLDRGYTIAHIAEMLGAWESGQDLADVLGLAGVIGAREVPATMARDELVALLGSSARLKRLARAGAVTVDGDEVRIDRPDLIAGIVELSEDGISVDAMIDVMDKVAVAADGIAADLLAAGVDQLGARFTADGIATEQVGELVDLLVRVRAATLTAVNRTVELALEERIAGLLGTYLSEYVRDETDHVG